MDKENELAVGGTTAIAIPTTPAEQFFQLVNVAMANGNMEQLDKILAMKQKFEAEEARKSYADALSDFQGICPEIKKDTRVYYVKGNKEVVDYNHESFNGLMKTIKPSLKSCGLSVSHRSDSSDGSVKVTCVVTHKDGHFETTTLESAPDASGGKNSIQAVGSAVSYLKRYTTSLVLGLSSGEEEDDGRGYEEPTQVELISNDQAENLRLLIVKNNCRDIPTWCRHFSKMLNINIEAFGDIPASAYEDCFKKLQSTIQYDKAKVNK